MKRYLLVVALVSVLVLGSSSLATAEHTRLGPPCISDNAGTEPKGDFELGIKVVQTADPGLYTNSIWLVLTYGIADRLEVFVAPQVYDSLYGKDVSNKSDFGDLVIGGKYQLLKEENLILSSKLTIKLAPCNSAHSKGLSTGEEDYKIELLATKYIGKAQFDLNLGYNFIGDPKNIDYSDELRYSLAVMYPLKKIIVLAELVGKTDKKEGDNITFNHNILDLWAGLKWRFNKVLVGKTAIGTRLSDTAPDYLGFFAVAYYF